MTISKLITSLKTKPMDALKPFLLRLNLAWRAFNHESILFAVEIYPKPDGRICFSYPYDNKVNIMFSTCKNVDFTVRCNEEQSEKIKKDLAKEGIYPKGVNDDR